LLVIFHTQITVGIYLLADATEPDNSKIPFVVNITIKRENGKDLIICPIVI